MSHTLVLYKNGEVYGQGANVCGQLGKEGTNMKYFVEIEAGNSKENSVECDLRKIHLPEKIKQIGAGKYCSLFLTGIFFVNYSNRKWESVYIRRYNI